MIKQKQYSNGFTYLEISNNSACARIAMQGAHLFHYERVGERPLLWLSSTSFLTQGKAIRGGIPICWPWFGKHPEKPKLPQHGFARNVTWDLVKAKETNPASTEITLQLRDSEQSLRLWPYRFTLLLQVTIAETLRLRLTTTNCNNTSFVLSAALHSYFAVSDIGEIFVQGLEDTRYFDALTKEEHIQQDAVRINEEVDRVYQDVHNPLVLHDRDRIVHINAAGSSSAVVWNPWQAKSCRMVDMPDDGYKTMLCIETANALEDARTLGPEKSHTLEVTLS